MSVFVNPPSSNGCSVVKLARRLEELLDIQRQSVEAERSKRDFEKGK